MRRFGQEQKDVHHSEGYEQNGWCLVSVCDNDAILPVGWHTPVVNSPYTDTKCIFPSTAPELLGQEC